MESTLCGGKALTEIFLANNRISNQRFSVEESIEEESK